ncbi:CPBP family intramembrane glutamic endopeptidase, partial [Chloroflexota bacterium]
ASKVSVTLKSSLTPTFADYIQIVTYLFIAYGITWLGWIPSLIFSSKQGYLLPTLEGFANFIQAGFIDTTHIFIVLSFQFAIYGPLIGALIVIGLVRGKPGIVELWGRITKLRIGGRWYLWALLLAFVLAFVPLLLFTITRLVNFNGNGLLALLPFVPLLLIWQILTSGLEEPGWRGFLLPELQARFGGEKYIWLLGLAWAGWHYPFTIYHTLGSLVEMPVPVMVISVLFALAGNTMSIIGMTYIYVWLNNNTKSVFLAILFHTITNVANTVAFSAMGEFNPFVAIVIGFMPWAVIIVMKRMLGKDKFPGNIVAS